MAAAVGRDVCGLQGRSISRPCHEALTVAVQGLPAELSGTFPGDAQPIDESSRISADFDLRLGGNHRLHVLKCFLRLDYVSVNQVGAVEGSRKSATWGSIEIGAKRMLCIRPASSTCLLRASASNVWPHESSMRCL